MKIFGITIGRDKKIAPSVTEDLSFDFQDESSTIRPEIKGISIPEDKKPANIKPIRSTVLSYANRSGGRGIFNECEYDLAIINRIEDTDSYVHQAFVKKVGLMFKEGYELVGADPKTIQYIKMRLAQISRATGTPTQELLRSIGQSLIKKSNGFLVKSRKEAASGGRRRFLPGTEREIDPIAGFFLAPAETMKVEVDQFGKILRWKQEMPGGTYKFFSPEDVVHFYFNRKEGFVFGTPTIVPVVDDIRSLRKIEENIELLVYQHLFPLFHYKVGTDLAPASIDENGNDEIEVAKFEISKMPSEGGLVTSHRHEIQLIGAENRSLRAEGYLEHFKKRVFSGLGISAVDMGEGECYSADTETLTENGWKMHWQIDHLVEKIATFNPTNNRIEFHIANYKFEGKYKGNMVHFSNGEELDILVTPQHDMWARVFNTFSTWNKAKAEDILAKEKTSAQLLLTAPFEETFSSIYPEDRISDWATVVGWVLAAGSYNKETGNIDVTIQNKRFKRGHPLAGALANLGIAFDQDRNKTGWRMGYKFSFRADEYSGEFKRYIASHPSVLTAVQDLPIAARRIACENIMHAKGYSKGEKNIREIGRVKHFWMVNEDDRVLDILQTIFLSAGYLAVKKHGLLHKKPIKYVNVRMFTKPSMTSTLNKSYVNKVAYDGDIYCYNVPNHLFLTRRNGRVAINGNTANRATSDNMSRNLVDSVKDIQRTIESQFSDFVINELLLESTYGSDVLNEEYRVQLKFKEIDLDYQIKKEAHYADQFNKNVISQHEARLGAGRQPMRLPTAEEIEGDPNIHEKYPEWHATFFKLIGEPTALIQSMDEPYSAAAKAVAANNSTAVTNTNLSEATTEKAKSEINLEKAKAAAKPKPVKRKDSVLNGRYQDFENEIITQIHAGIYSTDWAKQIGFMTETSMISDLKSRTMSAFSTGYRSVSSNYNAQIAATIKTRPKIESRVSFFVNKLIRNTVDALKRQDIDSLQKDAKIQKIKAAFEALRFRNDFIENIEIEKAFNLGILEAAKDNGSIKWTLEVHSDSCLSCKNAASKEFNLSDTLDIEDVPPLHPHSRSKIKIL